MKIILSFIAASFCFVATYAIAQSLNNPNLEHTPSSQIINEHSSQADSSAAVETSSYSSYNTTVNGYTVLIINPPKNTSDNLSSDDWLMTFYMNPVTMRPVYQKFHTYSLCVGYAAEQMAIMDQRRHGITDATISCTYLL
jgi:hypothetical protein